MFAKLAVTVVALGACCCMLLAMRQARIQAAGEMARVQSRVRQQDEELWTLRAKIAQRVSPENVTLMAQDIGPLHPLRPDAPLLAVNTAPAEHLVVEPVAAPAPRREVVTVPQGRESSPDNSPRVAPAPGTSRKPANRKPMLPGHVADSRVAVQPHGGHQ